MIKAVIFDCFGVLTTDGWLPFKKKYFGHDAGLFEEAGRLNILADSGRISDVDFIHQIARLANVPFEQADNEMKNNIANNDLFDYIADRIAPKYLVGMLSNVSENFLGKLFSPEQMNLFSSVSLSCDTGYVKPDERAYISIIRALGMEIEDCLFIDDQQRYIDGARSIGLQSILYQDIEQMKAELESILKMPDTNK